MKKMMFMVMMMVMTISANAMSYNTAKKEASFLSDKMAQELKLSSSQSEDVYKINLDYLLGVNDRNDMYGRKWDRRNKDLRYVLNTKQYDKYKHLDYFYRPVSWQSGKFAFSLHSSQSSNKGWRTTNPSDKGHQLAQNEKHNTHNHSINGRSGGRR
ncbi:hypothetical protein [Prevotella sp. E13-27]|uniref:hypothetical protein n=1 Tax=Prevotella sp. E13-27 TaxID=2938122 RepID=UPI00200B6368|nr:hypothetical protein [Prevotella sp. E13-27]MCK8622177.1 hypothetical protein [Prevotella sp. E13-27]